MLTTTPSDMFMANERAYAMALYTMMPFMGPSEHWLSSTSSVFEHRLQSWDRSSAVPFRRTPGGDASSSFCSASRLSLLPPTSLICARRTRPCFCAGERSGCTWPRAVRCSTFPSTTLADRSRLRTCSASISRVLSACPHLVARRDFVSHALPASSVSRDGANRYAHLSVHRRHLRRALRPFHVAADRVPGSPSLGTGTRRRCVPRYRSRSFAWCGVRARPGAALLARSEQEPQWQGSPRSVRFPTCSV